MNKWLSHALMWLAFAGGGGIFVYVATEGDVLRGLGFVAATLLLDISVVFAEKNIERWKAERNGDS